MAWHNPLDRFLAGSRTPLNQDPERPTQMLRVGQGLQLPSALRRPLPKRGMRLPGAGSDTGQELLLRKGRLGVQPR